ncbi:MAG: hypothetical protein IJM62_04505 [Lachnospiraceae bacterium]|nr:hypothetical protein [Lachnospiraceae bacterium]
MARQVYSFSKIKKQKTKAGMDAFIMGVISLVIIAALVIYAVVSEGNVGRAGLLLYIAFMLSIAGTVISARALRDDDTYGPYIKSGLIINIIGIVAFLAINFYGMMAD